MRITRAPSSTTGKRASGRASDPQGGRQPVTRWVTGALATALTLGAVTWSLGIAQVFGWTLYTEQFAAAMLAACLALAFLHLPARRDAAREAAPWYDWLAAANCSV